MRSFSHFLKEKDMEYFKPLITEYELFVVRNESVWIAAFMRLGKDKAEMLFVSPKEQGAAMEKFCRNMKSSA